MAEAVRREGGEVIVAVRPLTALAGAVMEGAGCAGAEARGIAERLVGANLRGHDSHGVIRVPRYVSYIEEGRQFPNRLVTIEQENDVFAIVNGNFGFGQSVGEQTVAIGLDKVRNHGVAVTALRNAGHLGRIGDWSEQAAAANVVSIHMVNVRGSLIAAPFGGVDRKMSTSPFSAGIPLPDGPPIILDFATTTVAEGKALVAFSGGKALPDDAIVDEAGRLTGDPGPLYGDIPPGGRPDPNRGPGALTAFGGHKGSGLNFLMEMMAGALTGSGCAAVAGEAERRRFCNGMLSIYMAVDAFHADDGFAREVRAYVAFLKDSRPVEPGGTVLIPGEKELQTMAARRESGVPLSLQAWEDILATAERVGLDQGAVGRLLA